MKIKEFFDKYLSVHSSEGKARKLVIAESEGEVLEMALALGVPPYIMYKTRAGLRTRIHPLVEERLKRH